MAHSIKSPLVELRSPSEAARWLRARVTGKLHADSRKVQPGDGFIAWPGAAVDGRKFVGAALEQGAGACLIELEGAEGFGFDQESIGAYPGLKAATSRVADAYYESPSRELGVVAITGTNGKTSTAWWLASALSSLNLPNTSPCGLIGTLGTGVPPAVRPTGMTTPDPVLLNRRLRDFVDQGVKSCAIEASSIGIAEHRLDGMAIKVAVFTNFTQDHLDYHGSMEAYWEAKAALFDWPGLQAAVINLDDPRGVELEAKARAQGLDVWTVSLHQSARLRGAGLAYGARGLVFDVQEDAQAQSLDTSLIGDYNASNVLCVMGALRALGVPLADAARACTHLPAVPGRMERVGSEGEPLALIDYAHTPDALQKSLEALRLLAEQRGGVLWCVFGCGGNRDASKRPLMAAAVEAGADRIVVTSDNPRGEDPLVIIQEILAGFSQTGSVLVESDRALAIAQALAQAAAADVVLIAGKGHEDYQETNGERLPFSDQEQARSALLARRLGS
ncbi:UDP-N-acetylmuramoyl-L-alanyl-D-glutamate--2,6-diaminopimelate ligase [Ottowia thiooxydans]|uniref:UDP-N-acetylmuramoyl-L-alanyl-D-glutamate--2, 6-diaminopimelate ligase n=1 Tax=Ottowia thiooxydans TaxID=219182 RepID=UPI000400B485|nr:UDP-N-acetylmuramoyl-L-alanyl-D-glutamate--2,6-diaminopimelate ligase [Ottowia thiooxydans]